MSTTTAAQGPIDTYAASVRTVHEGWGMTPTVHSVATVVSHLIARSLQDQTGVEALAALWDEVADLEGVASVHDVDVVTVGRAIARQILPDAVL